MSAHRDLANPEHRAEVARLWGVEDVPATPGKSAVEMFEAAADGQIKALWIACTNPAQSMPDQAAVRRALERCELVVVQEAYATTATARYADVLLPATSWGEKDGTVTNSERCISRVRPAVAAPGEARHDWHIGVDFARRLESRLRADPPAAARLRPASTTLFPYDTPRSVWNEHRESTRGRDLDITGLDYARIEQAPEQWPFPEGANSGRPRLYEDGRYATPDGKARFVDTAYEPVAEPRDARYPYALNTGRLRDQWHGMSRTGTLGRLFGHEPEPGVDMHPQDMQRLGLVVGDLVQVSSRRGEAILPARASDQVAPLQCFIAMHWGDEHVWGASRDGQRMAGVNALTSPAYCPQSKQPELKHAAVKVTPVNLPWRLLALAWLPAGEVLTLKQKMGALVERLGGALPFALCVPFGRERSGLLLRAAASEPVPQVWLEELEGLLGLSQAGVLHYADGRRGQRRSMRLVAQADGSQRLDALLMGGDISAEAWVKTVLQDELPAQAYGRLLLSPGARPPVAVAARGKQVCSCFDVSEPRIVEVLQACSGAEDARLSQLQQGLKCGTQCGSCVPELKRLVRATATEPA
jgi:assimilatory nitrate reductase catalytic subunit